MPRVVDAEQRRAELTDAAARVIARSGIEAATLRGVAAEAGWTTGALTHYFTDKRELLLATYQASLAHRRSLRPSASESSVERLTASLTGALPLDESRRRHWLVTMTCLTQASGDDELAIAQRDAYREFRDHVTGLIEAIGVDEAASARLLAERMIAVADGIAIQALFDPDGWPPECQLDALHTAIASLSTDTATGNFV